MTITYERREWEPVESYYFKSSYDQQPICVVTRCADHWELRFMRGSTNPGPFPYKDFTNAKRQVIRYLEPREDRITGGPPRAYPICGGQGQKTLEPVLSAHPSRKRHRRNWWQDS